MRTKLTVLLVGIMLTLGGVFNLSAQVTIGKSLEPVDVSVLELISQQESGPKGLRLPLLSAEEVDILASNINQLSTDDKTRANGLMIFNTTTSCVMVWNGKEFKSLCGDIVPAEMIFYCSNLTITNPDSKGFVQGTPIDGSVVYLTIPVTVTKAGTYSVTATTGNGYSFSIEGTMLDVGNYNLRLAGQGTPITGNDSPQHYDYLTLSLNGENIGTGCTPSDLPSIPVAPAVGKATFTFECGSTTVNGIYIINTDLGGTHTITVKANVSNPGFYTFTAEAAGMKFSRSGEWTSGGLQEVTLLSAGKPTQAGVVPITIVGEIQGGTVECNKTVTVSYRAIKIAGFGWGIYQPYTAGTAESARAILQSAANFGLTGTVPTQGITIINGAIGTISSVMSQNPDIIVIGYNYHTTAADNAALKDFLENKKGFLLAVQEANNPTDGALITALTGSSTTVSGITGSGGGVVYQMTNVDNEILNGPFGDIRGKYLGEDASLSYAPTSLPSGATLLAAQNFSFVYNNFVWVGDGGFLSGNRTNTDPNAWPSKNDSNGVPVDKSYRMGTVSNSTFYANVIAMAIKYVQENKK